MNIKERVKIKKRWYKLIRTWKYLAQEIEDYSIIQTLQEDIPQGRGEHLIECFRKTHREEFEKVKDSINRYNWVFTETNRPTRFVETALIYLLVEKETEEFWFPRYFIDGLEKKHKKLAEYFSKGYIENLSLKEISELLLK